MSIENKIRSYILENYLFTDDQRELNNDDSLLEKGIIDSTGIMELVFYLEEDFNIKVDDEDIVPENMDSVTQVVNFINLKQAA